MSFECGTFREDGYIIIMELEYLGSLGPGSLVGNGAKKKTILASEVSRVGDSEGEGVRLLLSAPLPAARFARQFFFA